jgi:MFS family permease
MSERSHVPIQALSILVAILIGCILAYAYQVVFPSLVGDLSLDDLANETAAANLLVFITVPTLAGFIAGLIHPRKAMINGLYAGLVVGTVNAIMAAFKMLFEPREFLWQDVYAFTFFAIIGIFLWMIIAATNAMLGKALFKETGQSGNPPIRKTPNNPGGIQNSFQPDCPYRPQYLASISNETAIPNVCLTCEKATECLQG